MKAEIVLARDFTDCPCGRLRSHGPGSGEEFREVFLRPALAEHDIITVDLNGADSLPPAFLDEAFGPLVTGMGAAEFARRVQIALDDDRVANGKLAQIIVLRAREFGQPRSSCILGAQALSCIK